MSKVVVIGAGIAGLAASALLAREGHEVTVLESRPEVGGRAGRWDADGFRFDTGPSWYLMPEVFDHFYKLLGTSAQEQLDLITLDPGYRVYFEGEAEPVDISPERADNLALFERMEKGAGRRLDRYLESAEEIYELALEHFLYTTFKSIRKVATKEVVNRTGTFVRLLLQPLSTLAARTVRNSKLRQILGYPAVFLGSSPYTTPSMYHLMSHLDLEDGVRYPMGGFTRLIESIADLARAEGVEIITRAPVRQILVKDGRATGVEYLLNHADVHFADADIVVSGADLHHTETQLLEDGQRTYPQAYWDERVAGPGALLIMLGVTGELPELEHHTLLFAKDWRKGFDQIFGGAPGGQGPSVPSPASLYICKPSGVDPDVAPDDHENLFILVPIPADPSIGRGDVGGDGDARIEQLADSVIQQVAEWAGVPDLADRIVLRRTVGPQNFVEELNAWKGTALGPAHTLKQSAFFRAGNVSKKVRGLYYVGGSTIPGIGLPMCLISAELLIKRLRGDTSTTPLPEPLESTRTAEEAEAVEEAEDERAEEQQDAAAARRSLLAWFRGFELPKRTPRDEVETQPVDATDEDLVVVDDAPLPADGEPSDAEGVAAIREAAERRTLLDLVRERALPQLRMRLGAPTGTAEPAPQTEPTEATELTPEREPAEATEPAPADEPVAEALAADEPEVWAEDAVEDILEAEEREAEAEEREAEAEEREAEAEEREAEAEEREAQEREFEADEPGASEPESEQPDAELEPEPALEAQPDQEPEVAIEAEPEDPESGDAEAEDAEPENAESTTDAPESDTTAGDESADLSDTGASMTDEGSAEAEPEAEPEPEEDWEREPEPEADAEAEREPEPEPEPQPDPEPESDAEEVSASSTRDEDDDDDEGSLVDLVKSWARDRGNDDSDRP